ncbi:MAG TPA: SBBP repeat-containing protein [Bryobacteraceae bacterium]|jgi:uncharacterized protein (TIGR03437 family)|nr:SBBP repeat-containing protein [Bryobacteraceae bacterium]
MTVRPFLCLVLLSATPRVEFAGQFATALSGPYPLTPSAIATDSAGNTYVAGSTQLAGAPAFINSQIGTQAHVFVTKLDPNGNVVFTDTFAGQGVDTANAIAVDPSGNIYIAGMTTSPDFPISHALQTQMWAGGTENGIPVGSGFVTKLSSDGTAVLYSTFFGGTLGQSAISALAVDTSGNLYLTGYTQATDFPHTPGMPFGTLSQSLPIPGAIIASISPAGDKILYSGAIPLNPPCNQYPQSGPCINSDAWEGVGIAVDPAGNAYIAGNANNATGLPTTPGVLAPNGEGAFVAKITAGGSGLSYLTFLGPGQPLNGTTNPQYTLAAIAVDAEGNAYLGGQTTDPDFPATPGSFRSASPNGIYNGFLAKLNPTGSALVWASFFDPLNSIALDAAGNVWANGSPSTPTLPNQNGLTPGNDYVAGLNAAGSGLIYSALAPTGTVGQSLAVDPSGLVHAAGLGGFVSAIDPFAAPGPQISYFGNAAGSSPTTRLAPGEAIAIYGVGIGPATPAVATPVGSFYPTSLAGVEVSMNGVKMPLLYAGANQINAIVPMELTNNAAATVHLVNGTTIVSSGYPVWIVPSAPMAFGPVSNQDGTLNSYTNPAKSGSIVTFYATGWQATFFPLADGQVQTMAADACQGNCLAGGTTAPPPPTGFPFSFPAPRPATSLKLSATVLYGGDAPGMVAGITQFNVQLGALGSGAGTVCFDLAVQGPVSAISPGPAVSVGVCVAP